MKTIVYGFLGTTLDSRGKGEERWKTWRPSVAICQQKDLTIDEYHLVYDPRFEGLAQRVEADIQQVSPETILKKHHLVLENPWDFEEVYSGLADFLDGQQFHTEEADYLFNITTGTHVVQICIFLLVETYAFPGQILQSAPDKRNPVGRYTVIDLDLSRYDRIASRFATQAADDIEFLKSGIETKNTEFNSLIERIELVALRSPEPILLTGPTGAGKSSLARKIFELKRLHSHISGEFIEINCATLRGDAAMSTLFGHIKGAFTGAIANRTGLLKAGDGGIVFLDEIGELGLDEQAMLLRAIEEKRFLSVGADKETDSDFQLICGSNRDLWRAVEQGNFREDLLSRINLWSFRLPGLADRREDIAPNLDYELKRFTRETGEVVRFNREVREKFLEFAMSSRASWSGNFRDLNGAVVRMCTLAASGKITSQVLNDEIARLQENWNSQSTVEAGTDLAQVLSTERINAIDPFDIIQLQYVLKICKQSSTLSEAGRQLYSVSRLSKSRPNDADRLKKYLGKFGLDWQDIRRMVN